ncbi:MAG: hypothetical protein QG670_2081 [Thermoproteota archaeon]|nr:hypothetical protein [Thermoproteota archaeon]
MSSNDWSVVVLKAESDKVAKTFVDFYRFVEDLIGVKDMHFLIRGRVDDDIFLSFRILLESKEKDDLENIIALRLEKSMPENAFAINPDLEQPFYRYVSWPWRDTINRRGLDKFTLYCSFLSKLSRMVVEMAEKDYFNPEERVEMIHVASWMLGCTEYGQLSVEGWEIGYCDHITNKNFTYQKQVFPKRE